MQFFRGTVVQTPAPGEVQLLEDRLLAVSADGAIAAIMPGAQEAGCLAQHGGRPEDVLRLGPHQFLLPGLIDTHIHAPQYAFTGTATDIPLMHWLQELTLPTEARYAADPAFARHAYSKLIARLVAGGTTTALLFATMHLQPCCLLADLLEQAGLRALVGKVCLDRHAPDYYREGTEEAVASTEAFIQYVQAKGLPRLQPVVTPRFLPTCSPALLRALGQLAERYGTAVTSHISESYDEAAFSASLEAAEQSEAEVFDEAGLLRPKAVFAHGVLLSDADLELMRQRGAAVAHCPLSNLSFADRILPVADLLRRGNKVGLGTDVAGGYSPSMLSAMRAAVMASLALHTQRVASAPDPAELALQYRRAQEGLAGAPDVLSWRHALWLATMGGAQALGLEGTVGSLEEGKQFDALLVDAGCGAAFDLFEQDTPMDKLEKFVNLGDDRHVTQVWVQGRPLKAPY